MKFLLKKILNIIVIMGLMISCSKDGGFDCFKSTGEIRTESRDLPSFHYIELHDNINLFLTQDSAVKSCQVEAGENLMPGITTVVDRGHLVIRNENTCDWVRSFDVPINVSITFPVLDTILYRAAGDLTFLTPWKNDSIQLDVWEGAGTIALQLDVFKSRLYVHYGVVNLVVSGRSEVNYISSNGYGPVNALELNTNFTYLGTSSPNDCYLWARSGLGVTIENIGNVYYKGYPASIDQDLRSSGKLIHLE